MNHHCDKIIDCAKQIIKSKWCLFVVKKKVISINVFSSVLLPRKRYITKGGGVKNLYQGGPQSKFKTGSEGENLTN